MSDERLARLEDKLDIHYDKLTSLAINTAENTASLKEHMAQTAEVREQTRLLKEYVDTVKEAFIVKVSKIEVFIDRAKFSGVILGWLATAVLLLDKLGFLKSIFHIK